MESKKINQLATSVAPQTSDLTIIGDPVTGVSKKITLLQIANLFATTGTVSSVAVTETGEALTITGSPITTAGTINIGFAGDATQYVRGDGALADFPTSTGGGSSVSYYLNSSVSQGTIGGVAYRELSKDPISGAGTDITISADGYVASYITDANDPALLEVPGGNFNCEFYFSVNSNAHNPYVYAELYKYDGSTFTLLGSSQSVPEYLSNGTTLSPYYFAIPVATAALTITDRLAVRIYVDVDGRTVTLHTENNHLCQVVTTFSKGLISLNNLTRQNQFFGTGTSGTDFNISSTTATHTFNIPSASATNRGLITTGTQTIAGAKTFSTFTQFNDSIYANADIRLANVGTSSVTLLQNISSVGVVSFGTNNLGFNTNKDLYISSDGKGYSVIAFNNPGTGYTYTLPALSGTFALLEGTQTFSGAKTFSLDITVNSLTIGRGAGSIATNTVVGSGALAVNTTGNENTAIGINSLAANTTGVQNTGIGRNTLSANTTGYGNFAGGSGALPLNTTGAHNIAIGGGTLSNNTTGDYNIAIGLFAGGFTTGIRNITIGPSAGSFILTGSNNTIIGNYAGTSAMANNIVLADGAGNVRYQWNGTNNVFGNPISGTSASFSSSVTALSLIKSGGTSSQFLMADGSVNTSVLPSGAYLPLAGGTLTGALSGTSATFSSTIGTAGDITITKASDASFIVNNTSASGKSFRLVSKDDGRFYIQNTGVADLFNITSTGAATFSSSVTANSTINGYLGTITGGQNPATSGTTPTNPMLNLTNNRGVGLYVGGQHASPFGIWMQVADTTNLGNYYPLLLNPNGGNVGINNTTPAYPLDLVKVGYGFQHYANSINSLRTYCGSTYQILEATNGTTANQFGYVGGNFYITVSGIEKFWIKDDGDVLIGTTTNTGFTSAHRIKGPSNTENAEIISIDGGVEYSGFFKAVSGANYNGAACGMVIGRNTSSLRSINAGGTVNAAGTDYAEYMLKAIEDNIAKGDIVGINSEGKLTNIFDDSISFVVKSTDPSYVGGDTWGNSEAIGEQPRIQEGQTDEEYEQLKAEYEIKLEEARAKVDRIAFSGQVPCNVLNAKVGDYIIPINNNGKISGQSVTKPTFEEYQISVGKVWKIMEDGRAWIAVKIG